MYAIISSSPACSSSSTELGTGDGVDRDCRLDDADPATADADELADVWCRALDREIFGVRSLSPFDGDRAAKRLWLWVSLGAAEDKEVTELVDALRRPVKDIDSRFFRVDVATGAETWRGTRDEDEFVEGDARTDIRWVGVTPDFTIGVSPLGPSTPNSSIRFSFEVVTLGEGEAVATDGVTDGARELTLRLARRAVTVETDDTEPFNVGDGIADGWPVIRGIFVGVSLGKDVEMLRDDGGGRLGSLNPPFVLSAVVATDGDPAMVGSGFLELRRDVSDCLCIELMVWDVALEPAPRLETEETGVETEELRLATRWAVTDGKAPTCRGGNATTGFAFLGSVEETVWWAWSEAIL
jgi:hypothetical protein